MAIYNTCLLVFCSLVFCSLSLCYDLIGFECNQPTKLESFNYVTNGDYYGSYFIGANKNEQSCFRTVLSNVNGIGLGYVEWVDANNQHQFYNKTLTRSPDGTVIENYNGRLSPYSIMVFPNGVIYAVQCLPNEKLIHVAYAADRPDLYEESGKLAKYYVEHPDDYKVDQSNCKYEDIPTLQRRLLTNSPRCDL